ncbi:MAG: T9SS type A sorting domain-containing protein [Flavobacteriaceae bacterium]
MKKITLLAFLLGTYTLSQAQTLDQSQLLSNAGMSARTLNGYSYYQSITPAYTGTLSKVELGFFNYINGAGTLRIYEGNNNLGTLLQTISSAVFCGSGDCMAPFETSVAVTSGQPITLHFTPGAGMPDPYGVLIKMPGNYSRGEFALIDPSGTYIDGWDTVFRTYVTTNLGVFENNSTQITMAPNPMIDIVKIKTAHDFEKGIIRILNNLGQQVFVSDEFTGNHCEISRGNLAEGLYYVELSDSQKVITTQKLLIVH